MSTAQVPAGRYVGQRILRREDPRLITGHGSYVDDVRLPGMLHLRSPAARSGTLENHVDQP